MVKITTSWNNQSAVAQLNPGDDIGDAVGVALGSIPADKDGKLQVSLRLLKTETVDVAEGDDIASIIVGMFSGMASPDDMELALDFNVVAEEDTADMTGDDALAVLNDEKCIQFTRDRPASAVITPPIIIKPPIKKLG